MQQELRHGGTVLPRYINNAKGMYDTGEKTSNGVQNCGTTAVSIFSMYEGNIVTCSLQRIRCSFLTELLGELTSCVRARYNEKQPTERHRHRASTNSCKIRRDIAWANAAGKSAEHSVTTVVVQIFIGKREVSPIQENKHCGPFPQVSKLDNIVLEVHTYSLSLRFVYPGCDRKCYAAANFSMGIGAPNGIHGIEESTRAVKWEENPYNKLMCQVLKNLAVAVGLE
ncbi:hypothetical protein TbgDal_V6220 [Trypanosoma brucei gambiense DAL972]|uniref:Uncharacterized protein n=1 Tax=Trypanosoma brucei gambiense (strain MHOM/CI/86/DAL972) TaxID=679716 RepID=C9ZQ04_TRYB9|nr:hypothetical protein TbgDal_V6220 [Trypanosoma brucei gambiense DAL972]CBH11482.1 hypothetical protein TbgDal_V6220 [Trypanosoma brucei gambiense DAL972]|eukprot:XP_011773769.1 hypothetical protein TbgDal_V6220 [Trypanosoma brucei gambiense DAL972]